MAKVTMGASSLVYPKPAWLVGANVGGRPNFLTVGAGGVANGTPPMISVAIHPARYSFRGIEENGTFSVNVPSIDQALETDYCGVESGSRADKVEVCGFEVFYGRLGTAPMIEQFPVNLECRVVQAPKLGSHTLFIGQIEEVYVSEECLTDGRPDLRKIRPLTFVGEPDRVYVGLGDVIAKSHSVGLQLRRR
ncbi:MAG: flavin reductase family protein [Gemmatimonadetes bacterium]|nr:flavin reductase family protein [Gemmatimonadota bacterium]